MVGLTLKQYANKYIDDYDKSEIIEVTSHNLYFIRITTDRGIFYKIGKTLGIEKSIRVIKRYLREKKGLLVISIEPLIYKEKYGFIVDYFCLKFRWYRKKGFSKSYFNFTPQTLPLLELKELT